MDRDRQHELPGLQLEWIDGVCLPLYKASSSLYHHHYSCRLNIIIIVIITGYLLSSGVTKVLETVLYF